MGVIAAVLVGAAFGIVAYVFSVWLPWVIARDEERLRSELAGGSTAGQEWAPDPGLRDLFFVPKAAAVAAALGAAISTLALQQYEWGAKYFAVLCFVIALLSAGLSDYRTRLIPDALTLPMLWIGLLSQLLAPTRIVPVESGIVGAVLGYMLPWSIGVARMAVGRTAAIGGGDLKLMAMIGAWIGPTGALATLFSASVAVVLMQGVSLVFLKAGTSKEIPFGPWLALFGCAWILFAAR